MIPNTTEKREPPPVTRGLNSQNVSIPDTKLEVSLDWLQGTGRPVVGVTLHSLLSFLQDMTGEVFTLEENRPIRVGRAFANSGRSCNGALIAWNEVNGGIDYLLSLPASVLAALPLVSADSASLAGLCLTLYNAFAFRATRLDIALDDYSKIVSVPEVAALVRAPRVNDEGQDDPGGKMRHVVGVRETRVIESQSLRKPGMSVYFGSTQSLLMVRFYEKFLESQGEKDCNRWEAQFRKEKAAGLFKMLVQVMAEIPEELSRFMAGHVLGAIDLVEFHEKNLERCVRLWFWQVYRDAVQLALKVPLPKRTNSLQQKLAWIERSVSKTLAIFADVFGVHGAKQRVDRFVQESRQRFTLADYNLIQASVGFYDEQRRCAV